MSSAHLSQEVRRNRRQSVICQLSMRKMGGSDFCASQGFAIPQLAMDHRDVDGFLHELQGCHDAFRECFARSEPREHFFRYMVGQFSRMVKLLQPVLTAKMLTKPAIILLALPLAMGGPIQPTDGGY